MRYRDQTDMGGPGDEFLTTHWSLIGGEATDQDEDRALVAILIQRYWKPVYCYLRRKEYPNEEAKDLTQSFFHEIVLNRRLLERADPSRGRFRTFLLHALDQFLIDQRRKEAVRRQIPKDKLVPLDVAGLPELPGDAMHGSDADCFTYVWKSTLIDQTVAEVSAACRKQGLQTHWRVFEERVLRPIYKSAEPPAMCEVCARCGVESEAVASNMLVTVKRRFREALRRNLRLTVLSEDDVDAEFQEMLNLFGKSAQERTALSG
jgi:DNA-directed RNA polymerase specialized sigma24 family protein